MAELWVLTADDWRLWREVRLAALADAPEAFGTTLEHWSGEGDREARWRQRLLDVPMNLVAHVDGVPVGQASGTAIDEDHRVELISMWVAPAARGPGVADSLVEAVVDWAQAEGATGVRLSVRRANDRAIRLYLRRGFAHVDEPGDEPSERAMVRPSH
jgi:ribosomal protein S18 acetylase RimI-like enzyme